MRILRSSYSIKLENLLNSRIRIEQVNLIKLKLNLTITLILIKDIVFKILKISFFTIKKFVLL